MDSYINLIKNRPEKAESSTPTGAICGNGDLAVILDDENDDLILHIAKSDFWKFTPTARADGGIKSVGSLRISRLNLDEYNVKQIFNRGIIEGNFGNGKIELFVATENCIYISISADDNGRFPEFTVEIPSTSDSKNFECNENGFKWYLRKFSGTDVERESAVSVCCRRLTAEIKDGIKKVEFCLGVATNFDTDDYVSKSIQLTIDCDYKKAKLKTENFWKNYFCASKVTLPDKQIEQRYNASLYLLGCCMGNNNFPPGLFGNFITSDNIPWKGDYHLNYNFEAPFYCMFSSNHVENTQCYIQPLLDMVDKGNTFAELLNCKGVYLPVSIGPKGVDFYSQADCKENGILFLGQKSNAAYAAVIPIMYWYSTYDKEYAKSRIYPYISEVVAFWDDYLVKENGRYVIKNDAVHEIPYYRGEKFNYFTNKNQIEAKNNILSLGLVRMLFKCIIDMSEELGINSDKILHWMDIVDNLSEFPTFIKHGKRCFRYTERGISWRSDNSVGLQHIYPASQVGLSSDSKTLKIARNTYFINDRRLDDNGSVSYLPCGARLGVNTDYLLEGLRMNIEQYGLPNMLFDRFGGCIEHLTTVPATINEMLMQSHEGVIRLFPCWDRNMDASFSNLRADGAFLVSAEIKSKNISNIAITSLMGRVCRVEKPLNGNIKVIQKHDGKIIKVKKSDSFIEFKTQPGITYILK